MATDKLAVAASPALTFAEQVSNFPEDIYPLNPTDHLTNFLQAVLGPAGTGQFAALQAAATLSETLAGTEYSELDAFFGNMLNFPRLSSEIYTSDPFTQQLTASEWANVGSSDASYKNRIRLFLQAINLGATNRGLTAAATAASGVPCSVLELWRRGFGVPTNLGRLPNNPHEVLVVPQTSGTTLSVEQEQIIYTALAKLKPMNVAVTVDDTGVVTQIPVTISNAASPSEYFSLSKYVTVTTNTQQIPGDPYYWPSVGTQTEAPTFAHQSPQEISISYANSISQVTATTVQTPTNQPVNALTQTPVVPNLTPGGTSFGPWILFALADSPDNFPNGEFPGDPSKQGVNGYIFAYPSQAAYVAAMSVSILAQGGQVSGNQYRLPVVNTLSTSVSNTTVSDAITPVQVNVTTPLYGG